VDAGTAAAAVAVVGTGVVGGGVVAGSGFTTGDDSPPGANCRAAMPGRKSGREDGASCVARCGTREDGDANAEVTGVTVSSSASAAHRRRVMCRMNGMSRTGFRCCVSCDVRLGCDEEGQVSRKREAREDIEAVTQSPAGTRASSTD
jgi:hypothetical protein